VFRNAATRAPPTGALPRQRPASLSDPRIVDQGTSPRRNLMTRFITPKGLSFMLKPVPLMAATLAAVLALPALAQDAAKAKAAPPAPPSAAAGKQLYPQAFYDFMIKQRTSQGQPDSPELRAAVRDELNTRELLVKEAKKQGLDKNADIKTEM